jgi:uncharacterized BrkB/YihY/UPF0761 family membrane protein
MTMIIVFFILWVISGAFAYAIELADECHHFPPKDKYEYKSRIAFACLIGFFGPIGLFVSIMLTGFAAHGLKWK